MTPFYGPAFALLVGCNQRFSASERHTVAAEAVRPRPQIYYFNLLAWYDYDGQAYPHRPERALFVLNGVEEGRGREGLKRTLYDLASAPQDTVLYIAFYRVNESTSRPPYSMPYDVLEMRPEWDQVIEGGKLRVEWVTGSPF